MDMILALGPDEIKPDYDFFPWTRWLQDLVNGVLANAILIAVILIIVGVIALAAGKITDSQAGRGVGWGAIIVGILVAVFLGNAGGLVDFFSNQNIMGNEAAGLISLMLF